MWRFPMTGRDGGPGGSGFRWRRWVLSDKKTPRRNTRIAKSNMEGDIFGSGVSRENWGGRTGF